MNTTTRPPLYKQHHRTLNLLFKFRFLSAKQLATIKHITPQAATKSLHTLYKQNYLSRHYDNLARIDRRPAIYFLNKQGIKALRDNELQSAAALHPLYNDQHLSERFMAQSFMLVEAFLAVRALYHDTFEIFSKHELHDITFMPETKPALYLRRIRPSTTLPNSYFLELYATEPSFVMEKRLKYYLAHAEAEDWQEVTGSPYPTLLFVCASASAEQRFQKAADKLLLRSYAEDVTVLTTASKALLAPGSAGIIWRDVNEPEEPVSLII